MLAIILPAVEVTKTYSDEEAGFFENKCINNPDFIILTMQKTVSS